MKKNVIVIFTIIVILIILMLSAITDYKKRDDLINKYESEGWVEVNTIYNNISVMKPWTVFSKTADTVAFIKPNEVNMLDNDYLTAEVFYIVFDYQNSGEIMFFNPNYIFDCQNKKNAFIQDKASENINYDELLWRDLSENFKGSETEYKIMQEICKVNANITNQTNANSNSATSMVTYQNDEYNFSLSYPCGWRHNSVDTSVNSPYFPFISMALEEFGSDDVEQAKTPFTENDQGIHVSIEAYEVPQEYSSEDVKNELGYTDSNIGVNIYEGAFGNYDALVKVRDDTNHEIESARKYRQSFLIQNSNIWYEINITARRESVIEENSTQINNLINSFRILED